MWSAQKVAVLCMLHRIILLMAKYSKGLASSIPDIGLECSPRRSSFMNLTGAANAVGSSPVIEHHMHVPNVGGTMEQSQCFDEEWCLIIAR
jgi:hypothetical protein